MYPNPIACGLREVPSVAFLSCGPSTIFTCLYVPGYKTTEMLPQLRVCSFEISSWQFFGRLGSSRGSIVVSMEGGSIGADFDGAGVGVVGDSRSGFLGWTVAASDETAAADPGFCAHRHTGRMSRA